jgi:TIR domain
MEQVFISYATSDREIANQIQGVLNHAGIQTWSVESLKVGGNLFEQIDSALRSSSHLVLLLSSHSTNSPSVANEYRYFLSQNKPLIPVLVGDISVSDVPASLQRLQWLDLRNPSPEAIAQIVAAIHSVSDLNTQRLDKDETPEKKSLKLTLNLDINEVSSEKLRDIVSKLAEAGVEEIKVVNVDKAS